MIHAKRPKSPRKYFQSLETSDHKEKGQILKNRFAISFDEPSSASPHGASPLQSELLSFFVFSVSLETKNDGK